MKAQNDTVAAGFRAKSSRNAEPNQGQSQVPPRPQKPVPRAPEATVIETAARPSRRRAARSSIRLSASRFVYVSSWTILGVFSAAYVVGALLAPREIDRVATALLGNLAPVRVAAKPAVDPAAVAALEASTRELKGQIQGLEAGLAGLAKGVSQLELSNGFVKTHLKAIEAGHPLSTEDISAEEKRLGGETAVFHPETPADGTVEGVVMDNGTVEPKTIEPQAAPPAGKAAAKLEKPKVVSEKVDAGKAAGGDLTDALDGTLPDAPVAPPKKLYGVELASGKDTEGLRTNWEALHDIQPKLLDGLSPQYANSENAAEPYRLLAGPLSNAKQAYELCKKLAAQNFPCKVAAFIGNPL